nr:uncharacterized protein LOC106682059 [Halyomorpha halys]
MFYLRVFNKHKIFLKSSSSKPYFELISEWVIRGQGSNNFSFIKTIFPLVIPKLTMAQPNVSNSLTLESQTNSSDELKHTTLGVQCDFTSTEESMFVVKNYYSDPEFVREEEDDIPPSKKKSKIRKAYIKKTEPKAETDTEEKVGDLEVESTPVKEILGETQRRYQLKEFILS